MFAILHTFRRVSNSCNKSNQMTLVRLSPLCSLDTVNAGRVAEYIASQRSAGAQYIVVSHKPQVRVH